MDPRSARSRWSAILAFCAACLMLGCGPPQPNVLIVVMDACRPDKMGCYGFENPTSPAINRLARDPDGVVFERHYVQGNWTKPSTASLFTGLYVNQHRVNDDALEPGSRWLPYLHPQLGTVAETFNRGGYFTWALVKIPHLDPVFGLDRGFAHYERRPVSDRRLAREVLELARSQQESPFFGYVHFIACHYPYKEKQRSQDYMEEFAAPYPERERAQAGIGFRQSGIKNAIRDGRVTLEPADVEFLNRIYEATLRRFDAVVIGPLIQGLRESGLYDNTLIVLTADHGEELYDHRRYGHGHDLWEEVVHVPLIVKFPLGTRPAELGARSTGLSRAIDLFPSLAAVAGLDIPEGLPGRDIFAGSGAEVALSESGGGWALVRGDEKLIAIAGQPPRLYDLRTDRLEHDNLAPQQPELVRDLRRVGVKVRAENRPSELAPYDWQAEPLPPEAVETLRSLGYVD